MRWKVVRGVENILIEKHLDNINENTKEGVRQAFYYLGYDLVNTARKFILEPPKTGRIYRLRRLGRSISHQASAPGESPANLSGKLGKAIDFKVSGSDSMEYGALAGRGNQRGVMYAGAMEKGTTRAGRDHNTTILSRPYLIRAIRSNARNGEKHMEREISKKLTKRT